MERKPKKAKKQPAKKKTVKKPNEKIKKILDPDNSNDIDSLRRDPDLSKKQEKIKSLLKGTINPIIHLDPKLQAEIALELRRFNAEKRFANEVLTRDMGVLESVISEYLKTFIVIGYDINGDKITITHATNVQEYDSIVEHARGTLLTVLLKAQQNLPGMPPGMPPMGG